MLLAVHCTAMSSFVSRADSVHVLVVMVLFFLSQLMFQLKMAEGNTSFAVHIKLFAPFFDITMEMLTSNGPSVHNKMN